MEESLTRPAIQVVVFDLDHTLYDYPSSHQAGLDALEPVLGPRLGWSRSQIEEAYNHARSSLFEDLGPIASAHSRSLYLKRVVEAAQGYSLGSLILDAEDAYWQGYFEKVTPLPGAQEVLETLRRRGFRLGMLTNLTNRLQLEKLRALGFEDHFERIVTSEEAGIDKPHPGAFDFLRRAFELPPESFLMVGDDFENDIQGASRAGMASAWLRHQELSRPLPKGAFEIETLGDLLEIDLLRSSSQVDPGP